MDATLFQELRVSVREAKQIVAGTVQPAQRWYTPSKPIVIIDIHDVCNDMIDKLVLWHNILYKKQISKHDLTEWDMTKKVDPQCGANIYKFFAIPDFFRYIDLKEDAKDVLTKLREKYTLVAVTSVNRKYVPYQVGWIHAYLPNIFDSIVIARQKGCFQPNTIYAAIEDNPNNLRDIPAQVRLLMDAPHNQTIQDPAFNRVHSWLDIAEMLL